MSARVNINRSDVWSSTGFPMSQGVVEPDGRRVHLTGQVAWDPAFNVLHKGDAAAQTHAALDNIEKVLAAVGGTLDDVVSLTSYFVRADDRQAITAARKARFKQAFGPAATGIQVAGLWDPDLLVELTVIAVVPHDRFREPKD
ncbi:MAG: RidA family protein [Roseitalea sp.]|jgi:enamine deaminase RidA (YjgF/YER057c/UK114 family)|nr:RidA family protein [Roseitalea sp.]MBO6723799.1 RidA family protein [Roseitalea sp.]MBO6741835.1 RidA family protein [Roseitalea sp.]